MGTLKTIPCALTVAGSDSGGGAGIQADLTTFAALGVHGASALTCITAQNPNRVFGVQACKPELLDQQLRAVYPALRPAAVKTGMLYSAELAEVVAKFLVRCRIPLVVDPVMVSTSGARLLQQKALRSVVAELFPRAALITPNLAESELLLGLKLRSVEDMRRAARELWQRHGCAALVKGGHLRGVRQAVDIFYDGRQELLLTAPFIRGIRTHGTGCTYSAAITALLARGLPLERAVPQAKQFVTQAIAGSHRVAGHFVLNWFYANVRARSLGFS